MLGGINNKFHSSSVRLIRSQGFEIYMGPANPNIPYLITSPTNDARYVPGEALTLKGQIKVNVFLSQLYHRNTENIWDRLKMHTGSSLLNSSRLLNN